ncbi:MAG: CPBP family intramembrane metalloprotease [Flavobacteriales bacterium]|nr:CPBP family intramembrane metalloprotease [Flavobacteriales bacterium]
MREALKSAPPLAQLAFLILVGIVAMSALAGAFTVALALGGVDVSFLANIGRVTEPFGLEAYSLKVMQLAQALGLFVVPYVLYRTLLDQPSYSIGIRSTNLRMLLVFGAAMVASLPMINFLAEWNAGLELPGLLSDLQGWIEAREQDVEHLLKVFLVMETPWHLVQNLFLIALVPAIAEEMLFRGTLQPLVFRMIKNEHVAIWLTAFLFSFFHMQFLGFFPRLLLGAVFGYAAHWSGSLLLPMVGHLINNGVAVLIAYFIGVEALSPEVETLGANEGQWMVALFSAAVLIAGMWVVRKRSQLEV